MSGTLLGAILAGVVIGVALVLPAFTRLSRVHAALLAVVGLHGVRLGYHVDDAAITMAQARGLARGWGLRFTPDGPMVEAVSNPLWTSLQVVLSTTGLPLPPLVEALELTLGLASVALVAGLAGRAAHTPASDLDTVAAAVSREQAAGWAALAAATSGVWVAWSTAGLEGALLGVLILGLALAVSARAGLAVLLIGAAIAISRPEGALLAIAVSGAAAWRSATWRPLGWAAAGAVAGAAGLHGLRLAWVGTVFPRSAVLKGVALGPGSVLHGLVDAGWAAILVGAPVLFLGLGRPDRGDGVDRAAWAGLGVLMTGLLATLLAGGDWMRHGRFVAPFVPLTLAWAVPALVRRGLTGSVLLVVIGGLVTIDATWRPTVPIQHGLRRGALYGALGEVRCGRLGVATPDVGGVRLAFPELPVHDLAGLTAPSATADWPVRLAEVRPPVVDLHGGWASTTGLSDAVLEELDYTILCRRGPSPTAPTLWGDARCGGTVPSRVQLRLEALCAEGSGVSWPGEPPRVRALALPE